MASSSIEAEIAAESGGGRRLLSSALLASAVVLWLVAIAGLSAVLLDPALPPRLAAGFDALDLRLPLLGHLPGETVVPRLVDKLTVVFFAIVPVLLLEAGLLGAREGSLWRIVRGRSRSSRNDLAIYLLIAAGLWKYVRLVLTFGLVSVAGLIAAGLAGALIHFHIRVRTGSLVADCALAFLLFTFCDYWNHRLQHHNPLWPLHRMHHGAEEMTTLTLWREHPAISAFEPLIKFWPLALFDMPAAVVAIVGTATVAYEHLIHSNLRWDWGWFGRWVLIPPIGHRLHHHIEVANQHKNFGIPVLWDRVFGTWDGRHPPSEALGVSDVAYNTGGLHRELWRDLKDFLRAFAAWVGQLAGRR